jgi:hypothetical protein
LRSVDYFQDDNLQDSSVLRMVTSLPALVSLDIESLTFNLMDIIATNLRNLEKLSYEEADEGIVELFEEMKRESFLGANMKIQSSHNV